MTLLFSSSLEEQQYITNGLLGMIFIVLVFILGRMLEERK